MSLDIKAIRFVMAVIDEGSFTRAAARLRVAQPWLSTRIKRMEDHLGFAVLTRSTRRVSLTPRGQELIEAMRNMDGEPIQVAPGSPLHVRIPLGQQARGALIARMLTPQSA